MSNEAGAQIVRDEDAIDRGGTAGAVVAFWMSAALLGISIWRFGEVTNVMPGHSEAAAVFTVIMLMLLVACLSLFVAAIGYFWGENAAKCRSASAAFVHGAVVGAAIVAAVSGIGAIAIAVSGSATIGHRAWTAFFLWLALVSAYGAALSGLSAIYARDYRQFRRRQWLPQFTLREMLLLVTLAVVMLSAITSLGELCRTIQ